MTRRNAYFGLKSAHVAPCTDVDAFTYATPVNVSALGGIMELKLDAQSSRDTIYGSDVPWIDSEADNGFTGTIKFVNIWGNPTLRVTFAPLVGYEFAADGTLLGTSDADPVPFALLAEPSGNLENKRDCYLMCRLGKPSKSAQTRGETGNHVADEFSIVARPVTLPSGWTGSFYENIPSDGTAYENFYSAVRTDLGSVSGGETTLAALTFGTERLTPNFNANTQSYTLATTESELTVTAVPVSSDAVVEIENGTTEVTNGGTAEFSVGENTVTVTVTNGSAERVYTIEVTRS